MEIGLIIGLIGSVGFGAAFGASVSDKYCRQKYESAYCEGFEKGYAVGRMEGANDRKIRD